MAGCPHDRVQFCPLYVAAHDARFAGLSCEDGRNDGTGCAVERGRKRYARAVAAVRAIDAQLVAQCAFAEMAHDIQEQRARNMRLNGVQ